MNEEIYEITIEDRFDAAHFLKDYDGKCQNLHGHSWLVKITLYQSYLQTNKQNRGMVLDFTTAKQILKSYTQDKFDHSFIFETGSISSMMKDEMNKMNWKLNEVPFRPTAENFAKYFYKVFEDQNYQVEYVEVYETLTNKATYRKKL